MRSMDCVFCQVVNKSLPADIVFEDADLVALRDIHPKAPVHILVMPKVHVESIAHLETNHTELIAKIIYAAKQIAAEQGLNGYKLAFNVGRAGGQVVDHLHLHLLGGWNSTESRKTAEE